VVNSGHVTVPSATAENT